MKFNFFTKEQVEEYLIRSYKSEQINNGNITFKDYITKKLLEQHNYSMRVIETMEDQNITTTKWVDLYYGNVSFKNFFFDVIGFDRATIINKKLLVDCIDRDFNEINLKLFRCLASAEHYLGSKLLEIDINATTNPKTKLTSKRTLSNPKKLALLHELGIFDLPLMKSLTEDKQNEIIGLLLDADKKEFVYKNRLNINSKDPNYQTDKYTAYQYLEDMKRLIYETE